ncbi:MED6 mediator sub complex component-domain-containing protein [Entophlyctis helioformis]|nr:MED6 mediator sub complex component-domain-containing protein [Entophlyctis helioformis]
MADPTDDDLTGVSFKDTAFLQAYGLNEFNVLDYFALSQFYDNSCLNEQLKMQARFNELQAHQLDRRQMRGLEFDLWYYTHIPSLYVIRKQTRHSPTKTELIAVYYIIEGTIYQAPSLYQLLSNRVRTSLYFAQQALETGRKEYRYHPIRGYRWSDEADLFDHLQTTPDASASAAATDVQQPQQQVSSLDEQRRAMWSSQQLDRLISTSFVADEEVPVVASAPSVVDGKAGAVAAARGPSGGPSRASTPRPADIPVAKTSSTTSAKQSASGGGAGKRKSGSTALARSGSSSSDTIKRKK